MGGLRINSRGSATTSPKTPIGRLDMATGDLDTAAFLPPSKISTRTRSISMSAGSVTMAGGFQPFANRAAWAVAPDGRVALVHAEPYHVEWVHPDGQTRAGPHIDYRPVTITDRDKEAWADRLGGGGALMIIAGGGSGGGGGGRTMRLPRPEVDNQEWPDSKPPFPAGAASVTPEGTLWVQRHVRFGGVPTYDEFGPLGERIRQVILPAGRRLVGFGPGKLYAVHVDEDDLQRLEVYER